MHTSASVILARIKTVKTTTGIAAAV